MYIYFLSTGRTGTTFLTEQLNVLFPELKLTHQQRGSRVINIVANLPFENSFYLAILKLLFKVYKRGYPPFSTLDPLLSMALYKLLKNGRLEEDKHRIVHLTRSPETFVTSFMNWKRQSFKRTILHHFIPFWNPVPLFHGVSLVSWIRMSKFEKFCWVWNFKNQCFSQLEGNEYYLLKMEDLTCSYKESVLKELALFVKQEYNPDLVFNPTVRKNRSKINGFPSYEKWNKTQKSILKMHCSKMAKKMKYEVL